MKQLYSLALAVALLSVASAAGAHEGTGMSGGLISGFMHPILGWDHVVAMVAVGLWGAFLGRPAIWVLPVVFPLVMALGGALGVMGVPIPAVETGIAASAVVLGAMVALAARPPIWIAAVIVGGFAIFSWPCAWHRAPYCSQSTGIQHWVRRGDWPTSSWWYWLWSPRSLAGWKDCCAGGRLSHCFGWCRLSDRRRMIKRAGAAVFLTALALPQLAFAHSSLEGIGSFYNGALHPLMVPAHLLSLIALGLLLGQRGLNENQINVAVFLVATAVGLVIAWFAEEGGREVFILTGATSMGLLIVSSLSVWPLAYAAIAALAGLILGMDSTQEQLAGQEKLVAMVGSWLGSSLLLFYAMAFAHFFSSKAWQKIGIRIIGSWVAASSLLVLALSATST